MDIQKIKELALANGFKLKEQASGNVDLNAYVYDFANAIEQEAKAQAVPEWISVDDELPSEGDLLLGISTTKLAKFNVYQVVALDEFDDCEITHWMHLPQAPKAQEPAND